jgi:hypothetical protein
MRAEVLSDHGSDSGLEDGLLELQFWLDDLGTV